MVLGAGPEQASENEVEAEAEAETEAGAETEVRGKSLPNVFVHIVDKYVGTKSCLLLILGFSPHTFIGIYIEMYIHTYLYDVSVSHCDC